MCGRYALGVRLSFVRYQMQQLGQRVDDADDDEQTRESYNFAPGYYGAVLRAETPDTGGMNPEEEEERPQDHTEAAPEQSEATGEHQEDEGEKPVRYRLQSMKWGLIPFWTKRNPDYGSLMRTINCRDDSLMENRGMWTSMKKKKRCIVVCQGFYEWLKKGPTGKERIPHFIKRKDGNLLCFAGLWDCVQYEGSDEKLYTYTIITTSSNPQLRFLHDRMPVILEPGSEAMATWLDPKRTTWTKELQSLLKPYEGELECYPVSKDVGKVGNNSPNFMVPLDSKENKRNIANFFGQKSQSSPKKTAEPKKATEDESQTEARSQEVKLETEASKSTGSAGVKREHSPEAEKEQPSVSAKAPKIEQFLSSPNKPTARQMRSATSNNSASTKASNKKKPAQGTPRITSFFGK